MYLRVDKEDSFVRTKNGNDDHMVYLLPITIFATIFKAQLQWENNEILTFHDAHMQIGSSKTRAKFHRSIFIERLKLYKFQIY